MTQSHTRLLIVGAGEAGRALVREIRAESLPVEPVAFLDDDPALWEQRIEGLPVIGDTSRLVEAAHEIDAQEILIAIPSARGALIRRRALLFAAAILLFISNALLPLRRLGQAFVYWRDWFQHAGQF